MASEDPRQDWAAPGSAGPSSDAENLPGDSSPGAQQESGQPAPEQTSTSQWGQPASAPTAGGGWETTTGQTYQSTGTPNFQPMQSHRPGIIPLRALRVTEILDGAFKAIRHNPKVVFGVTLPVAGISSLLQTFAMLQLFAQLEYDYLGADFELDSSGLYLNLLVVAINLLMIPLVTGILTISVSQSTLGRKRTLRDIMRQIKGRKAALVGISLVVFLLSISPVLLPVFGMFLTANASLGTFVLTLILTVLATIVGIVYLTTRFLFVTQVVVLERQPAFQAIKRGWLLTRGSFWRILGIYLLASLIASVVSSIVSTPLGFLAGLLTGVSTTLGSILIGSSTVVTLMITIPFSAAVAAILYIDVRMRREGLDIELARAAGESG